MRKILLATILSTSRCFGLFSNHFVHYTSKKLALFYTDYDVPETFLPYLKNGTFKLKEVKLLSFENNIFSYYIIYKPTYKNKAKHLEHILRKSYKAFNISYERKIGRLLGYSNEDIEYYIKNLLSHLAHA